MALAYPTQAPHSRSSSGDAMRSGIISRTIALGKWLVSLFLMLTGLSFPTRAQSCPATISVAQRIDNVPEGWTARQDSVPLRLAAVSFYDGPPEQNASLAPEASGKGKRGIETEVWKFRPKSGGIWIGCSYASTNITITRKLESDITECIVTYNPRVHIAGNREISSISCRTIQETTKEKQAAHISAGTMPPKKK